MQNIKIKYSQWAFTFLVIGILVNGIATSLSCSAMLKKKTSEASTSTPVVALPPTGVPTGWPLVWADEFNTDGLPDTSKWDYDTFRNPIGWYNDELQYYSANRTENAVVASGNLIITARKEQLESAPDWGKQKYTSARLLSRGKGEWTYGFYEIRAKLPCGLGTWPAIWMLGIGGQWPADGEIDIMEHSGPNQGVILGTIHNTSYHGANGKSGQIRLSDVCNTFHKYQMYWNNEQISFGVDDQWYHQYPNPRTGVNEWPFDNAEYMLLNVAVGGTLGGPVDDSIFPVKMEIDYVRVYQKPN